LVVAFFKLFFHVSVISGSLVFIFMLFLDLKCLYSCYFWIFSVTIFMLFLDL